MNTLQARAEAILTERWGGPVALSIPERLTEEGRPSQVYRCRVEGGPAGAPATVILKQRVREISVTRFLNELAGAEFLTEREAPAVRFHGGDRQRFLLIIDDLGSAGGLDVVLNGNEPGPAQTVLQEMARGLGRMHAATAGAALQYHTLRRRHGSWREVVPESLMAWVSPGEVGPDLRLLHMHAWFQWAAPWALRKVGVQRGPGFSTAAVGLIRRLGSGPLLAYNQGDPCPDNWRLTATGPRLIDFEAGGFRSALMDGAYLRMHFPTCWCAGALPASILARLEAGYREELAQGCPAVTDERTWRASMADACAYWAWFTVATLLPRALAGDDSWGIATVRPRILARLSAFLEASTGQADLDALRRPAETLLQQLTLRWGAANLPLFPCFQAADESA